VKKSGLSPILDAGRMSMPETLEYIDCNLCGSAEQDHFLKLNGFSYKRCRRCGLIYQNPRPVLDDLKQRYDGSYFEYEFSNQHNFFNLMKLGLKDVEFDSLYGQRLPGRSFLDVGCATGLLLNHMSEKGWACRGVEVCRDSAEYAARNFGLDIHVSTLEEASFPDRYFDAVHSSHLIEHLTDPYGFLLEVKRILKPDGCMILTTPNAAGFQARVARRTWRSAIPDHVYLFSKKTMRKLLDRAGFAVVKQVSWGGIPAGKRPDFLKRPVDRLAKLFNVGDVMLFLCRPA
jgi:2-polyprenyl-3-methyl-5-hydroxy-6-metoxy-1,4-benzoquinol methylase